MLRYLGNDEFEFDLVNGEKIEMSKEDILSLLSEIDDQNYDQDNSAANEITSEARLLRMAKRVNA